jgi:hypothetical protein
MNYCGKFIFIKEGKSLIFELTSTKKEIIFFGEGISKRLLQEGIPKEQPIKVTAKEKECVIEFLQNRYSSDRKINKLIDFFAHLETESYIFFYLYSDSETVKNIFDLIEQSLVYYNQGCSQEEIVSKMKEHIQESEKVGEMIDAHPYTFNPVLPERKLIIGECDKSKRKCIYCGKIQGDGKTFYKEKAHAIPEALGNKKFIQNEECDACNGYFAKNAEEDLSNMLMFNRLKYGLKGKNGYPIFQLGPKKYVRYFNWEEEDYEKNWGDFEAVKDLVKRKEAKCPVVVDIGGNNIENQICISNLKDYCPMHAYKTMVKCVIGLIGNEKLDDFKKTINWLRYDDSYHRLPEVAIIKSRRLISEPELYIFERKDEEKYDLPYCYGELRIMDQIFVFIIPFCLKDKKNFRNLKKQISFLELLDKVYKDYELCDLSDTNCKRIEMLFTKKCEL